MSKYVLNKPVVKRSIPWLMMLAFATSLLASLLTSSLQNSEALNGSQFNAGRIIDDVVFYNKNAMSANQIQQFLNAKVPTCDTNHAESSSPNDSGPPYTCLKDYRTNTTNIAPESGLCNGYTGASNESAATIIYKVAQSCGINPQVLLVTLQKEQSLVTDTWPWNIQYEKAMGAFCPDTAPCDSGYAGFFKQVYYGAHRFKVYKANPDSFNYKAGRNNSILWHPTNPCGTSTVYIQNQATAALYIYTPYRPNQAALNNLYGTGDSCSSYGNRNFWRMFNDWFGSPYGTPFFEIDNRIYMHGADNTYYYVPSPQTLRDYGYGETTTSVTKVDSSYVNGMTNAGALPLVARFEGAPVYAISDAKRFYYGSPSLFNDYGFEFGDEAKLPDWALQYVSDGGNVQSVMSDGVSVFYVEDGKAKPFCSATAYKTLGSPIYSTRPRVNLNTNFSGSMTWGAPITTEGTVVKSLGGSYGIWNGTNLQPFAPSVAAELGGPTCVVADAGFSDLPASGTLVNKLAKNSDGDLFILDTNSKVSINPADLTSYGFVSGDFITTNDTFLDNFASRAMGKLIRIKRDIHVFYLVEGTKHHVYSSGDLQALGMDFSQVVTISGATSQLFDTGGSIFGQGRLVRIGNGSAVYLIGDDFEKRYIPDSSVMSDYGYSFGSVLSVSGGSLVEYPTTGSLTNVTKDGSNNFWLVSLGKKHKISSTLLGVTNFDIDQGSTQALSTKALSATPTGKDLTMVFRSGNNSRVYIIDDGQKRYVTSPSALFASGHTWEDVMSLSPNFVSSLPDGPAYN